MNSKGVWILVIIIVLVAVGGLWYAKSHTQIAAPLQNATSTDETAGSNNQSSVTANSSITADTAAIDTQMQGLNQDSATVDQSFDDSAVPQEQL